MDSPARAAPAAFTVRPLTLIGVDGVGSGATGPYTLVQYDLDGKLCTYIEIDNPGKAWIPVKARAANYCSFRGMLFKSLVYINVKTAFRLGSKAAAKFVIGDHPRVQKLKELGISDKPIFRTA